MMVQQAAHSQVLSVTQVYEEDQLDNLKVRGVLGHM
jgi:hypothetical protein